MDRVNQAVKGESRRECGGSGKTPTEAHAVRTSSATAKPATAKPGHLRRIDDPLGANRFLFDPVGWRNEVRARLAQSGVETVLFLVRIPGENDFSTDIGSGPMPIPVDLKAHMHLACMARVHDERICAGDEAGNWKWHINSDVLNHLL